MAAWENDAPVEAPKVEKPWEKDKTTASLKERKDLEKEVAEEDYRIPGTDARIPYTRNLNTFLINTGSGMLDLWEGGKQIVAGAVDKISPRETKLSDLILGKKPESREAEITREYSAERKLLRPLQENSPYLSAAGRITGQIAPTLVIPVGAGASGLRALSGVRGLSMLAGAGAATDAALMGAAQGALNFTEEGESRLAHMATGAAFGAGSVKGLQAFARAPSWAQTALGAAAGAGVVAATNGTEDKLPLAAGAVAGAMAGRYGGRLLQNTAAEATQGPPRPPTQAEAALSNARDQGYVVPPTQAKTGSAWDQLLEGFSGKITTAQAASVKKQEVKNRLARESLDEIEAHVDAG